MPMIDLSGPETLPAEFQPAAVDSILQKMDAKQAEERRIEEGKPAEEKPAAEAKAAETNTPASSDETPAVDDAAATSGEGAVDAKAAEWLTEEVKGTAAAYGISDDELADIPSREVLDVILRGIDRKAFEAGKNAERPADKPKEPVQQGATQQKVDDALAKLKAFKLDETLGAEDAPKIQEAVSAIAAELDELRAFRSELQQQKAQALTGRWEREFNDSLNTVAKEMGLDDMMKDRKNRARVFDAHLIHFKGMVSAGRIVANDQLHITPALVRAAVNQEFAEAIIKNLKSETVKVSDLQDQSRQRMGGPAHKAVVKANPRAELIKLHRELTQNNH